MKIILATNNNPHFVNTNVYRLKAIRDLRHTAIFFDDRKWFIPRRIRNMIQMFHKWDLNRINNNLVKLVKAEKPDLCLVAGGQRTSEDAIKKIKKLGTKIVLWTTDPPVKFDNIIRTAPLYDKVFCAGTEAIEILKDNGVESPVWLPFGCEPDYHHNVELSDEDKIKYAKDIVFVGSYSRNRAKILESISDYNIAVWGPYWDKLNSSSALKKKTISAKLNYEIWVKIFSAAKIVIVIHFQDGKTLCHQASPKIYEALCCKSFVLCDNQKDAKALFRDKEHLIFFEDKHDLIAKIEQYLENPKERERIALNGYKEVITKHTYKHRIQTIIDNIK